MSPPPSPPPPPPPDTSPPESPITSRHSSLLPSPPSSPLPPPSPPPHNQLDRTLSLSLPTSTTDEENSEEDSDESYFYSDSDTKEEENAEIRRPKVSTASCYEVNASPRLSIHGDGNDDSDSVPSPVVKPKNRELLYHQRDSATTKADRSSSRGFAAATEDRSSRRGSTARVKKKKKKGSPRVTKYKENHKTVRQQIKPGTVDNLATLFTGWNGEKEEKDINQSSALLDHNESVYTNNDNNEDSKIEQQKHRDDRRQSKGKMDFIAASKVIQERLLLSRNNSLNKNATTTTTNENKTYVLKSELSGGVSTQPNNGLYFEESVTKTNTSSSKSLEDEKNHAGKGKVELERTNMTVGLQTNNEHKVHESKHNPNLRNNQGDFKLITSRKGKSLSGGGILREDTNSLDKRTSKSERDINTVIARPKSAYEPISIDNITLSEITQAANSHTSTHLSTPSNYYSNDLKPSRHSHATNNDAFLSCDDDLIKAGLDETDFKKDSPHNDISNTEKQSSGVGAQSSSDFSLESRETFKTMTGFDVIDGEEKYGGSKDETKNTWDSVSNSTASVKDSDGQSLSKTQDDAWITVDVPPHINGLDNDDVITNSIPENVSYMDGVVGISDVNSVSRVEDDDKTISSSSQTSSSKNYITSSSFSSSLGRENEEEQEEAVTKPLKNTFVTTERLTQPEHSANVNMQLLKNLQSQTREGSRPDVFAHSSRVWSGGMRSDGDGGLEGGEGGRMEGEERDGAVTGDIQTNKRPVLLHSQTQSERKDHNNLESSGDTLLSTCVNNSVTENVGDDFLSILDDINIDNNSTSYFVNNRNKFNSSDKLASKVSGSEFKDNVISGTSNNDDLMSKKKKKGKTSKSVEENVTTVLYTESQSSSALNLNTHESDRNNNSLPGGQTKPNIEEELQELHRKLSPRSSLKETLVSDYNGSNVQGVLSSSTSSLSSIGSSRSGHSARLKGGSKKDKNARETAFNVDFFTSSTEEKKEEELVETSRNDYVIEDRLVEVDQNSISSTTPNSKNSEEVSIRQRKLGTEESDLQIISSEESQSGAIIASRESFKSVRGLFESDKGDTGNSQRTDSFKNRRSLNLERRPSDSSKKWRRSGSEFGSWTAIDTVNSIDNSGDRNSSNQVNQNVLFKDDNSSLSSSGKSETKQRESSDFEETSKESNMTAVVGKVSSFNIHRRGGAPHQESQHNISSSQTGSNNSDVYLIQDKSGDVYALQEVNTTQPTVHTYEGDSHTSFDTSRSSQHMSSYHQPVVQRDSRPSELYVDGSGINDSKAREVISAYLSTDPNLSQNNTMSQSHSQTHESYSSSTINNRNPHSIVVHQGEDTGGGYMTNNGMNISTHGYNTNNNLLNNSTVTIDTRVDGRNDSSQTWSSGNNEPYTIGRGAESGYKSSLVVTNLNTPSQKIYSSHSNTPSMDTSIDSQFSGGLNVIRGGAHYTHPQQPLMVNVSHDHGNVSPFRTTPVTVQTTTTALVGEKVDMKIDFPIVPQPQVTTTAELAHSSSDEENRKHYIIKSASPKKSSLKISRSNNDSLDSNSDLIYTKKESLTGDIVIGGNRKTVIDNRANTDHSSKTYVMSNTIQSDRGRNKKKVSGKAKHHSPERYFKNAQLSLRKDNSSDEESKKYRTITRVVLDSDKVDNSYSRSGSESPSNRYRVVTNQSSRNYDNSFSEDDQYYEVDSRRSEIDTSGKRRRYKVINSSQNVIDSESVRAHSSPKPYQSSHSKSFEESHVSKSEHRSTPSQYKTLPSSSSKRHKTVIQLDLGSNGIQERARSVSEYSEPSSRIYRTKSVDSLGSSGFKVFQSNENQESRKMWRTGRARSVGSSSDESSSDFEGSGPYNLTPTLVNTSKQKRGAKTYVVKSTYDDHQNHPPGWYKSTIDINEKQPERFDQNFIIQSGNSSTNNQSFSQSERITQQRSDVSSSQATEKSVYYVRESAQPQPPSYTQIPIQASPDSGRGTEFFSSDGEHENSKKKFERVERIYEIRTEPELPEQFLDESVSTDMRVLRGKILIQNRMDESSHFEDEFEQNTNMFDNSFHTGKDNPLYASDSDLMAALRREEEQEMSRHVRQDITYDQVDSMSQKYKTSAKAEISQRPKRKQNLSTLLLSKLSNVDSKDIRQTINVEHHNEEIVGDINFIHADGKKSGSHNTSNFDSVTENVELTLQQGKAYVIIKVIAERIIPTDLEFNIWRKSQAIVTRQIEIDLLANEQRRRFYHHVMDTRGTVEGGSGRGHMSDLAHQERQLNSMETLKLFSQILDIADGQGDKDHTTMRTKQEMGQLPKAGGDLLY